MEKPSQKLPSTSSMVPSNHSTPVVSAHCVPGAVPTTQLRNPAITSSKLPTIGPVQMKRRQSIRFIMLKMLFPGKSANADACLSAHTPSQCQKGQPAYDKSPPRHTPGATSNHEKRVPHPQHQQRHSSPAQA